MTLAGDAPEPKYLKQRDGDETEETKRLHLVEKRKRRKERSRVYPAPANPRQAMNSKIEFAFKPVVISEGNKNALIRFYTPGTVSLRKFIH